MSNKRDFWDWLKTHKELTQEELKQLKSDYKKYHTKYALYNIASLSRIDDINVDGSLDLYREYFISCNCGGDKLTSDAADTTAPNAEEGSVCNDDSTTVVASDSSHEESDNDHESSFVDIPRPQDFYDYLLLRQVDVCERISFESEEKSATEQTEQDDRIVYDISTNLFSNLNRKRTMPMAAFVEYPFKGDRTELFLRSSKSFSYSLNPCNILTPSCDLNKATAYGIVEKSINGLIEEHGFSPIVKSICLIPDTLGDFKDNIKSQLRQTKGRVVPIPRSIAAAYAYAMRYNKECDLTVYDFDLDVPSETVVVIVKNKNGEFEFIRKSRRIQEEFADCSLGKVLQTYLNEYALKTGVIIPQKTKELLVATRDILSSIWNRGDILIQTQRSYETLHGNADALQTAFKPVLNYVNEIRNQVKNSKNDVCFLINVKRNEKDFLCLEDLCEGCREINKRIDEGETIWKEYLPELSLEVIRDGRFAKLWLIKKDSLPPALISEGSMQEQVDIPIENGSFTLYAGAEETLLPLEREEFGNTKRDKKAKFSGAAFPLSCDTDVRLKLSYSFGDPDSYKLTAVGLKNPDFQVVSEWRNESEQYDKTVWPEYDANEQAVVNESEQEEVKLMLDAIESKILTIVSGRQKIKECNRSSGESDIFDYLDYYCGDKSKLYELLQKTNIKINYKRNLIKKFTETVNAKQGEKILQDFAKSEAFNSLVEYLANENSALLKQVKFYGVKYQTDFSVLGFMSSLGYLYGYVDNSATIIKLLNVFAKNFKSEYIIAASRCISQRKELMQYVAKRIDMDIDRIDRNGNSIFIKTLRTISSVCWYNKEWLWNLYAADPLLISKIEKYLVGYFYGFSSKLDDDNADKRDMKELRDIAEVAVALCRLREADKTIFASEKESTKQVVKIFKRINNYLQDHSNAAFESRIKFKTNSKINKTCYLVISQLSGEGKINLTGFKED